ncbi:MAG: Zn-dependent hydrolase [Acidobacteria bacterium]|nr:Zn-dependent hydrolase [Acidobacteriota bacterium]
MGRMNRRQFAAFCGLILSTRCGGDPPESTPSPAMNLETKVEQYVPFRLQADLGGLSANQRKMLPLLIEAAQIMDGLFWRQAYGDKQALLSSLDGAARRFAEINYGPWDRLGDNEPFLPGVGPKPPGAELYPHDVTKQEFEAAVAASSDEGKALKSLYTVVEREGGALVAKPYGQVFGPELEQAAGKLREAAALAEDEGFRKYLTLRADALVHDDYQPSDMAWMDMKSNQIDLVIGPIETYEDQLYGYKASFEAYVLLKDMDWSGRLAKYAALLPALQQGLPVPPEYKKEDPGADSDLNAYDVLYYAGDCNAGAKTIAINLPNDEEVQLAKGARRLQLKNAMRAKFEKILLPIAGVLIAEDQREHVDFDAFFANTMFHEVAHGLGVKQTLTGKGMVREAMKEKASALEEGKADILGVYMVTKLMEMGELGDDVDLMDNYVTFLAGIFRSIRFGASSAHGVANLLRFNFFAQMGAFSRDEATGTYRVNPDAMAAAVEALSRKILTLQGDGDYDGAAAFVAEMGRIGPDLQADLDRLEAASIPVDIVFEQGVEVLGL